MRLVLETGAGLENANSYIDEQYISDYLPFAFMDKWNALTPDDKIDRLIAASLFIDSSYAWVGTQKTLEQGMAWPRLNVMYSNHIVPDDTVPRQVKRAAAVAVQIILDNGISIFQASGEAAVKREKLGPIETEYFEGIKKEIGQPTEFWNIDNLLYGFYSKVSSGNVMTAEVLRA